MAEWLPVLCPGLEYGKSNSIAYLQGIIVAARVKFHIEIMDGKLNAAPRGGGEVPDTFFVGWIIARITRAAEGACGSRQLPTTTCENSRAWLELSGQQLTQIIQSSTHIWPKLGKRSSSYDHKGIIMQLQNKKQSWLQLIT